MAAEAESFVDDYLRLARALAEIDPALEALPMSVASAPADYTRIAGALGARDAEGRFWKAVRPLDAAGLQAYLAQADINLDEAACVRVALATGVAGDWSRVVANAGQRLQATDLTAVASRPLLAVLHALADRPEAAQMLEKLVGEGDAMRRVAAALSTSDLVAIAPWVYTVMRHDPSLAPIYSLPSNLDDGQREAYTWVRSQLTGFQPELLEPLASAIIEMGHASTAFDVAERQPSVRYLMVQLLQKLAEKGAPARVFPASLLVDRWNATFPEYSSAWVAGALRRHRADIEAVLMAHPFEPPLGWTYAAVLDEHESVPGDPKFPSFCQEGALAADGPAWAKSLAADEGLVALVGSLGSRGMTVALDPAAAAALCLHVATLAKGTGNATDQSRAAVFRALDPEGRAAVLDAVLDAFTSASVTGRVSLLGLVDKDVFDAGGLARRPEAFVELARHVLTNLNDEWVSALAAMLTNTPSMVSALRADQRLELRRLIVGEQSKRQSEQARAALSTLTGAFAAT